ncbi:MAG TPA: transposase [Pseudohaliea sp.]|nr:transposase [Pseudohaliea sp.]
MPNYRRLRVPGGCYFFTITLQDRRQSLLIDHIDRLRGAVRRVRARYPFHIDAWVVLPEHMHALWTLPEEDDDYPNRWRLIKLLFVKGLPATERRSAVQRRRGERGIWQRRYWEHTIRSEVDYANHVDYIHFNPVRHGLVDHVADWPYSTFHRYIAEGRLPAGWARNVGDLSTVPE